MVSEKTKYLEFSQFCPVQSIHIISGWPGLGMGSPLNLGMIKLVGLCDTEYMWQQKLILCITNVKMVSRRNARAHLLVFINLKMYRKFKVLLMEKNIFSKLFPPNFRDILTNFALCLHLV
jgi:hypothetical protein